MGKVIIPSSVMYKNMEWTVVGIGTEAFMYSQNMTEVVLPNSMEYIDWGAFEGCQNLKHINLPHGIVLRARSLSRAGFQSLQIPHGTTWHGDDVGQLGNLKNVKNIVFEEGVDSIPNWGCAGDVSLVNVELPHTMKHIGMFAFEDCKSLKTLDIPNSVQSIGCPVMNSKCEITEIIVHWDMPIEIDEKTFPNGRYFEATLIVPKGTKEKYQEAKGCQNFMTIVECQ